MLRHLVMWTFADSSDGLAKPEIVDRVVELLSPCAALPPVRSFALVKPQDGLEASFDLMLDCSFDDAAGLKAYATDPLHQHALTYIKTVVSHRYAFDYEPDKA